MLILLISAKNEVDQNFYVFTSTILGHLLICYDGVKYSSIYLLIYFVLFGRNMNYRLYKVHYTLLSFVIKTFMILQYLNFTPINLQNACVGLCK